MSDKPDLAGPLAFFAYGLLLLALGAFLYFISPVRVDRLGGISARQQLEADGVIAPLDDGTGAQPDAAGQSTNAGGEREPADNSGSVEDAAAGDGTGGADGDNKNGFGFEPSRRVEAVEMCRLWMKDTPLFEETYGNGRSIGVSGAILELREFGGDYIITLDGAGPEHKTGKVECYFDPDQMLPLKALRAGDVISIVGESSGGVKGPILKHSRLEGRL